MRAASVKLWVTVLCCVESQNLGASEVVASQEVVGELDREETVVGDDVVSAPALGRRVVAVVENLEPAVTSSRVGGGIADLLQVDGTGTLVAGVKTLLGRVRGPSADLKGKNRTVLDGLDARDTLGATSIWTTWSVMYTKRRAWKTYCKPYRSCRDRE